MYILDNLLGPGSVSSRSDKFIVFESGSCWESIGKPAECFTIRLRV